eukprot:PhM_4_TR15066/c0_g1_i1/m.2243
MVFGRHANWDILNRSSSVPTLGDDDGGSLSLTQKLKGLSKHNDGLFKKKRIDVNKLLLKDAMGDRHMDLEKQSNTMKLLKQQPQGKNGMLASSAAAAAANTAEMERLEASRGARGLLSSILPSLTSSW